MTQAFLEVAGKSLPLDKHGYLQQLADWTPEVAEAFAQLEQLKLSDAHWEVIYFVREFYQQFNTSPAIRLRVKAMAEKLVVAKSRTVPTGGTVICATRYGNVMASRGSVIPLFVDQIRREEPLTVTDPSMTRFLMSLEDSVDLVLHAFEHGEQGDIFIQKAPASTVEDLAKALLKLFSSSSALKIIGTRHGEKLYESLVSREEMAKADDMGRYFRIPADNRDLNYKKYFIEGEQRISEVDDYTSHNTDRLNVAGVEALLLKLDYIQEMLRA